LNNLFTALIAKRIVATVSALVIVAFGCGAGYWQLSRANTKIALAANLLAHQQMPILKANERDWTLAEATERRMTARGQYIPDAAIWLDNRPRPLPVGGTGNPAPAGFFLMMPFRLEGIDAVLWVNRGWAPRNLENRETLPSVQTPVGPVSIEGIVFAHPGRVYELGSDKVAPALNKPLIKQNLDLNTEAKLHGWTQSPFILRLEESGVQDGLLREWAPLTTGVDRHYAYAFQWFALAACGFLFWLISGLRQYRRQGVVNGDLR
jgi:cytochrome oxidase assembly protein ShyY1